MIFDLALSTLVMNAAGSLGFAPPGQFQDIFGGLGAFITNPLDRNGRSPAQNRDLIPFPGGFLMHTGYPNPGLRRAIRRYAPAWKRSPVPIIAHLLADGEADLAEMVRMLEGVEAVAAVEISLPPGESIEGVSRLVAAAAGELPLIVRLPLGEAEALARVCMAGGAAAVSLGPQRGALPGAGGKLLHGRLYGPGLFPQALEAVRALARAGVPIIGAGGIYRREQVEIMLAAGAIAVQLDSVLWRPVS